MSTLFESLTEEQQKLARKLNTIGVAKIAVAGNLYPRYAELEETGIAVSVEVNDGAYRVYSIAEGVEFPGRGRKPAEDPTDPSVGEIPGSEMIQLLLANGYSDSGLRTFDVEEATAKAKAIRADGRNSKKIMLKGGTVKKPIYGVLVGPESVKKVGGGSVNLQRRLAAAIKNGSEELKTELQPILAELHEILIGGGF